MTEGTATRTIKANVKAELERAYQALYMASNDYDLIDSAQAAKISEVRRQVLTLLNVELDL